MKTNGFNLEALRFQSPEQIRLLVAIIVVLYVICVAEGFRKFEHMQARQKEREVFIPRESVFRKGYSLVATQLGSIEHFLEWLMEQVTRPLKVPKRLFFFNVQY